MSRPEPRRAADCSTKKFFRSLVACKCQQIWTNWAFRMSGSEPAESRDDIRHTVPCVGQKCFERSIANLSLRIGVDGSQEGIESGLRVPQRELRYAEHPQHVRI